MPAASFLSRHAGLLLGFLSCLRAAQTPRHCGPDHSLFGVHPGRGCLACGLPAAFVGAFNLCVPSLMLNVVSLSGLHCVAHCVGAPFKVLSFCLFPCLFLPSVFWLNNSHSWHGSGVPQTAKGKHRPLSGQGLSFSAPTQHLGGHLCD